jgi:hypothetical protein
MSLLTPAVSVPTPPVTTPADKEEEEEEEVVVARPSSSSSLGAAAAAESSSSAAQVEEEPVDQEVDSPEYKEKLSQQQKELLSFQRKEKFLEDTLEQQDAASALKEEPAPTPPAEHLPFNPTDKKRKYGIIKEKAATDIEESIFKRMRSSMFKTGKGGMFMLGIPDTQVLDLLIRVYNENIIRIAKDVPPKDTVSELKAMLGVLHINGELYVTISEDPREDDQYYKKIRLIFTLLKNTNCEVIYDEKEEDLFGSDPEVARIFGRSQSHLFPTIPFVYRNAKRQTAVLSRREHDSVKGMLLLDTWRGKGKEYDYNRDLMQPPLRVHFVHSLKYLATRRPENPQSPSLMFPPIKKTAGDSRPGFHECANGSTCSEAKLFSYIHKKYDSMYGNDHTFSNISGYAAYWIPAVNPPNHILVNYNYKANEFQSEFEEILSVIKRNVPDSVRPAINSDQFKYFSQLFALPCPGCFLNYTSYISGKMVPYDLSTCVKSRKSTLYTSSGGSRRRRNKIHKAKRRSVRCIAVKRNSPAIRKHTRKCRCRTKRMRK